MALIPAASEALLSNMAESARLAVIIDLLIQQLGGSAGVPPGAYSFDVAGVPFNSTDASGADAPVTDVPTAGKKLIINELRISVDGAMNVTLKEETTGTVLFGPYYMAAKGFVIVQPKGKILPTINKRLVVRTSAAGNITVAATYSSTP